MVYFSEIWTRIVKVEGEHADHMTKAQIVKSLNVKLLNLNLLDLWLIRIGFLANLTDALKSSVRLQVGSFQNQIFSQYCFLCT